MVNFHLVVESQSDVEFTEPAPPSCGFHTIEAPVSTQLVGLGWNPRTGMMALPVGVSDSDVRVSLDEKFLDASNSPRRTEL